MKQLGQFGCFIHFIGQRNLFRVGTHHSTKAKPHLFQRTFVYQNHNAERLACYKTDKKGHVTERKAFPGEKICGVMG